MPRRLRVATGGLVYHVLNRAVGRGRIFEKPEDYAAFERVLSASFDWVPMRLLSYCLLPNHWHLVVWPRRDGDLSEWMRWLTVTHTQRWHADHHTAGTGPLYQGRFKSFPIEQDEHLLTVCRYVERNALRAKLAARAEAWPWCSLWQRQQRPPVDWLAAWPVSCPKGWVKYVNEAQRPAELAAVRESVRRGRPFGDVAWQRRTARRLGLESTLRPRGRPRKPQSQDA